MPRTTRAALRQLENEQSARPDAVKFTIDHPVSLESSRGENAVLGIPNAAQLLNDTETNVVRRPPKTSRKKKDLSFADEETLLPLNEVVNTPHAETAVYKVQSTAPAMSRGIAPSDLAQHVSATTIAGSDMQTVNNTDHMPKEIPTPEDPIAEMDALQKAITDVEQDLFTAQNMESSSPANLTVSSASDPSPLNEYLQQPADNWASIAPAPNAQSPNQHETIADEFRQSTAANSPSQNVNDTQIAGQDANAENQAKSPLPLYKRKPFVPKKSTRPPLTTNFVLPGEVFTAKLKAAKEEQQSHDGSKEKLSPKPFATASRPSLKPPQSGKRLSTLVKKSQREPVTPNFVLPGELVAAKLKAAKEARELRAEANAMANTRLPKSGPRPSVGPPSVAARRTSMPVKSMAPQNNYNGGLTAAKSSSGERKQSVPLQVTKKSGPRPSVGKAAGGTLISEQDRADALRKARAEAAERGRLASKLWAEKKLAKKNHESQSAGEAAPEIQQ